MKQFTLNDIRDHGCVAGAGSLFADSTELIDSPLWWHKRGLSQTASGYGSKLTTSRKIHFCGKIYRLYASCFGNAASVWFKVKGKTIFVN